MSYNGHRMYADFSDKAWEAMEDGKTMFNNGFRSNEGSFFPEQPIFTEIVDPEDAIDTPEGMMNAKSVGIVVVATAAAYGIAKRKEIKKWITDRAIPSIKNALNIPGKKEEPVSEPGYCSKGTDNNHRNTQNRQAEVIDFEAYAEGRNKAGIEKAN